MDNATTALSPTGATVDTLTTDDRARIEHYAQRVISPKTETDYAGAWRDFAAYCNRRGFVALPATPATLAAYLTALAEAGASIAQIDLKRAAIRHQHHMAGHASPTEHPQVVQLVKGIRRTVRRPPTPKDELALDQLRQIISKLSDTLAGQRDKALLLVGFWGAFRRGELVAVEVKHVRIGGDGVMRITIPSSKSDQEGKGKTKTLPTLPDRLADVCAVRAYRAWLKASGIGSGYVFRAVDRWGNIGSDEPMNSKVVARTVKAAVESIGAESKTFAGHSLRRGFVNEATDAGATDSDMMETTGHVVAQTLHGYKAQRGRGSLRVAQAIIERHS